MKNIVAILTVLLVAGTVSAQLADQAEVQDYRPTTSYGMEPASTPFSLLDLSRVKWSNSYSVSFFSGGYGSGSVGLWNSTMFYEFSSKLSLTFNLGVSHNAGSLIGEGSSDAAFLPGFLLEYKPSESFQISVGYQRYNGYNTFANPYFVPYGSWLTR